MFERNIEVKKVSFRSLKTFKSLSKGLLISFKTELGKKDKISECTDPSCDLNGNCISLS